MVKIKHVQGNSFRLGIPLVKRVVGFASGSRTQNDNLLAPLMEDKPIKVIFSRCRVSPARLSGRYVVVDDKGTLPVGNYHVTVLATDSNGDPLRYRDDFELGIVYSAEEADYEELNDYDGYFKFPIPDSATDGICLIVVTDDAVQFHEGAGFDGEVTEDAVKLYARFGPSEMEVTEDAVKITIK